MQLYLPTQVLRNAILSTAWCVDQHSTRYSFSCVAIQSRGGKLYAVATDSRRMVVYEIGDCAEVCSVGAAAEVNILLPLGAVRELEKKLTATAKGSATISTSEDNGFTRVVVKWTAHNRRERSVELLADPGRYPRWWEVVPSGEKVGTLRATAGNLRSFLPVQSPAWTFDLNGHVKILREAKQARSQDGIQWDGAALKIDFDLDYIAEFLDSVNSSCNVEFDLFDSGSAGLMKAGRAQYVVMPLSRDR